MGILSFILPVLPVIYEDFKHRAIHWVWVALLLFLVVALYPVNWPLSLLNIFFLGLQLFLLNIYFSVKNKRWINLFRDYLGIGDLVFFIPLCLIFSPVNFILFFIISLSISLIGFLVFNLTSGKSIATIPLAGCMSLVLIAVILFSHFNGLSLNSDLWLIQFRHN